MAVEPTIPNAVIVNDESGDSSGQLAPGAEAVDGDGVAIPTCSKAPRSPGSTDFRPAGHWWFNEVTGEMYWSRGGGVWENVAEAVPPTPIIIDSLPNFLDDFVNGVLAGAGWTTSVSGGGASLAQVAPPSGATGRNTVAGVVSLNTGTSTSGRAGGILGANLLRFENGTYTLWTRAMVPVLANGVDRFVFRVGFTDSNSNTDAADGAYFEYDQSISPNWRCKTATANVRTTFTTAVPIVATEWVDLKVVVSSQPDAKFYINDVLVTSITSNIPSAAGRETSVGFVNYKTLGGTARQVYLDYTFFKRE
jgi:hypothetical protein